MSIGKSQKNHDRVSCSVTLDEDVPRMSNFLPGGGWRFSSTSKVCSTALEKRGPIGT